MPDIHIEMDETVTPVQQKQRQIPIHYKPRLKDHLEELIKAGVVTLLECTNGTEWIHNIVITAKKWSPDKIRMNLNTRPMKKAVKESHFAHSDTTGAETEIARVRLVLDCQFQPCLSPIYYG